MTARESHQPYGLYRIEPLEALSRYLVVEIAALFALAVALSAVLVLLRRTTPFGITGMIVSGLMLARTGQRLAGFGGFANRAAETAIASGAAAGVVGLVLLALWLREHRPKRNWPDLFR
jgi:hypothetical protein